MNSSLCRRCSGTLSRGDRYGTHFTTSWASPAMPMAIPNISPALLTDFPGTSEVTGGMSLWPAKYSTITTDLSRVPQSYSMLHSTPDHQNPGSLITTFTMSTDTMALRDDQSVFIQQDTAAVEMSAPTDPALFGLQTHFGDNSAITVTGQDSFTPHVSPLNYLMTYHIPEDSVSVDRSVPPMKTAPTANYPCREPGCRKVFSKSSSLKWVCTLTTDIA